jgi:hypothetical protein
MHQVVDARSPGRFVGTEPEPRPGLKGGHIPGEGVRKCEGGSKCDILAGVVRGVIARGAEGVRCDMKSGKTGSSWASGALQNCACVIHFVEGPGLANGAPGGAGYIQPAVSLARQSR